MAKPKFPRKNAEVVKEAASTAGTPPAVPENNGVATEAAFASTTGETIAKKTAPRKTTNKPEIVKTDFETVKTESRATLVPINLEEEIRSLAYLYSERRGFVPGHENEDWLAAEHEVMQRYHQYSA